MAEFNPPVNSVLRFRYLKTQQLQQSDSISITDSGFRLVQIKTIEPDSFAYIYSDSSTFDSGQVGSDSTVIFQEGEIRQSFGDIYRPQYILSGCLEDIDTAEWKENPGYPQVATGRYAGAEIDSVGMLKIDIVGNNGLRSSSRTSSNYARGKGLARYDETRAWAPTWTKNRFYLVRSD